jgi:hypothetical protein
MGDGKAKSVIDYLENLVDKGKASAGAIGPLKIAFTKVMQTVDGKSWKEVDVKTVDLEDYMTRFANLTMGKYSTYSLAAYKTRAGKALTWYLKFLETPGWTPSIQRRKLAEKPKPKAEAPKPPTAPENVSEQPPVALTATTPTAAPQPAPATLPEASSDRILYPYPLSDGQLIHISLPVKLSKLDAKRIGAFIDSIAVD